MKPLYFYPRSPCGERLPDSIKPSPRSIISIHALLAESDTGLHRHNKCATRFLSTLSLRRATDGTLCRRVIRGHFYPRSPCGERRVSKIQSRLRLYFYPRSPCGERHFQGRTDIQKAGISIHALLAESDTTSSASSVLSSEFLSTLSLRRATRFQRLCGAAWIISIHALLAESDAL